MIKFIQMDRASIEQRVANAMAHRVFQHLEPAQAKAEAAKRAAEIVAAAYDAFLQRITSPLQWVGTLGSSMENRDFSASIKARDAAAKSYFRTTEPAAIPDWLSDAMGFSITPQVVVGGIGSPGSAEIAETRAAAGLTQAKSANLVHVAVRTWKQYEAGDRTPHVALWELYLLKSGQHPTLAITEKQPVT